MDNLSPGTRIYGFCNGYFGRDSYGDKIIIASGIWNGKPWIVAEEYKEQLQFATGFDIETAIKWKEEDPFN